MSERENPFTKKAGQSDESKGKPGRKPTTPNFEQVIAAVERGEYDETLHELTVAISTRNTARQTRVMQLVNETFGADAVIEFTKSMGDNDQFTRSRMNVGTQTVEESSGAPMLPPERSPVHQVEIVETDETPDPLDHLDAVEQTMDQEAATDPNATISAGAQVPAVPQLPLDQRSSTVGGLAPSDMGDH